MKASTEADLRKEDVLSRLEALSVYRALRNANPKIKNDIKKLKTELVSGLSRHDRISGIWFLNVFKKVIEVRSKNVSLEMLQASYKTKDKEQIAKKLIAYYSNYGIAVGTILGASGGLFGFITAAYATFGELACLAYFQLCLLYDLSVLYESPMDKANNLEVYRLIKAAFGLSNQELENDKIDELVDKGAKLIEEKLLKNDSQVFSGLLKNLGAAILHKAAKNLLAKLIPLVGVLSGALVCITTDYHAVRSVGKRAIKFYNGQSIN